MSTLSSLLPLAPCLNPLPSKQFSDPNLIYKVKLLADYESTLQGLRKKQIEAQHIFSEALERERQKCERTIAIDRESLVGETQKNVLKIEREWETISNSLKRQLGLQQTQVVHLELQKERIERAGKVREETLQRRACTLAIETSVSSIMPSI